MKKKIPNWFCGWFDKHSKYEDFGFSYDSAVNIAWASFQKGKRTMKKINASKLKRYLSKFEGAK